MIEGLFGNDTNCRDVNRLENAPDAGRDLRVSDIRNQLLGVVVEACSVVGTSLF